MGLAPALSKETTAMTRQRLHAAIDRQTGRAEQLRKEARQSVSRARTLVHDARNVLQETYVRVYESRRQRGFS
jgi:hypothetical protein